MRNKTEIVRRLEKLEEIRNAPSIQDQQEVLDMIERSIAETRAYDERPENKARKSELDRQYTEYLKEPWESTKDGLDAQMKFWLWRVKKDIFPRKTWPSLPDMKTERVGNLTNLLGKGTLLSPISHIQISRSMSPQKNMN